MCISRFQNCADGAKDSPPAEGDLFRGSPSSRPKSKGLLPWQKPLGWVRLLGFLLEEYEALTEKGYNPVNQIVGYLLTEDPTYITNYNNARSLICKIDRDELLQELVRHYLFE